MLMNLDKKKIEVETEKVNKPLQNIPIGNFTKLSDQIYSGERR